MIWRCECADKAITKRAPLPATALVAADAAKHLAPVPATTAPGQNALQGSTVPRIAAHLGIATLSTQLSLASQAPMPASQQLPAHVAAPSQLPAHQQQLVVHQSSYVRPAQLAAANPASYDSSELVHQLPSSAPILLDTGAAALLTSRPAAAAAGGDNTMCPPQADAAWGPIRTSLDPATVMANASRHSPTSSNVISPRPPSRSPSIGLIGGSAPRQASPNSLAELVPSTTAVTVPPYSVISAAKAGSAPFQPAPVVVPDGPAVASDDVQDVWGSKAAGLAVKVGLKGQESIGVPDTPDQSNLILNRERSSLSKDTADVLSHSSYLNGLSAGLLHGSSHLSAPGVLYTSTSMPNDMEPDMLSILLDGDAFAASKTDVPPLMQD